jgi:hypothetical protein
LFKALQNEKFAWFSSTILYLLYQNSNYEAFFDNKRVCDFTKEEMEIYHNRDEEKDPLLWIKVKLQVQLQLG